MSTLTVKRKKNMSNYTTAITKVGHGILKSNPFVFMKLKEFCEEDTYRRIRTKYRFVSLGNEIRIIIDAHRDDRKCKTYLFVADLDTADVSNPDQVKMQFHIASLNNPQDFKDLLNIYLKHMNEYEHKYSYLELLWSLNNDIWNVDDVKNAIVAYDPNLRPHLCELLSKLMRCLSIKKQRMICDALSQIGFQNIKIYEPNIIQDALNKLDDRIKHNESENNIYQTIDYILSDSSGVVVDPDGNILLELKRWLLDVCSFSDYEKLANIFPLVNEEKRLDIVKRWFHDIRNELTAFSPELLAKFKDNQYNEFIKYRHCIESPASPVVLTVPLLCDNILTLYRTGGNEFLSYDGIMDLAITKCDTLHPNIDFKMNRFIPECKGGVLRNKKFSGFISYQLIEKLDQSKLNEDNVLVFIQRFLDTHASRIENNKWHVTYNAQFDFNVFLKNELLHTNDERGIDISINDFSISKFVDFIQQLCGRYEKVENNKFLVPQNYHIDNYTQEIIEQFCIIERMRIYPRKDVIVGSPVDIFGFSRQGNHNLTDIEKCEKEKKEFHARVVRSIEENYDVGEYNHNGNFFETEYNPDLLKEIKLCFYYKNDQTADKNNSFLVSYNNNKFRTYCAPKLSNEKIKAINQPFFWCQGKECFHNCLDNQAISESDDWRNYTIYHMIEIIGFSKLHHTEVGYEADPDIGRLFNTAIKVSQKFHRLKCRQCGHMLFTAKDNNGHNTHNYYTCINPNCVEYKNKVYLSHCFHCSKGLIDSRDHKKCPNGMRICPNCLSCCDDDFYEQQAQKYIVERKPVPVWINKKRGHGHNNKGIYYCPKCGSQIEKYKDEHGEHMGCPKCRETYNQLL